MSRASSETCKKCGQSDFGYWRSSSGTRDGRYCRPCRRQRAATYSARKKSNGGSHSRAEWFALLKATKECPGCKVCWDAIPPRPDKRYKKPWTKDHKIPLSAGGRDDIQNIQPLCYRCNFKKAASNSIETKRFERCLHLDKGPGSTIMLLQSDS